MAMNGVSGGSHHWRVGLINSQGKYLTAETFGFKINASGATMRKKQVWLIEHEPKADDIIYIRSHLGRYLSADKRGNVACNSETTGPETKFCIQYEDARNGSDSGKWAIRSAQYGTYFGGSEDKLSCNEKAPRASEWWTIHLAVHPQVNLRNVNRKKYACFEPGDDEKDTDDTIQVKSLIPWGEEAIITIQFIDGKYALKSCNNRFLDREGYLVEECDENCLYTLQIRSGQYSGMALKDCTGRFLAGVGMDATMQGRNTTIGKDELFTIEDSHPQVFFVAHNSKKVSIKQGVDLSANQDEDDLTDRETFQLEFDKQSEKWRLRTADNKYWALEAASGIQGVGNDKSANGLFTIEYLDKGIIAIKASNNRYITAKMNGSLYATSDSVTDKEKFTMTILNRPILIIKCEYGFWGYKASGNTRIECNKHNYEIMFLEHTWGEDGSYFIKSVFKQGAKKELRYLDIDSEGNLCASSSEPKAFIFQLIGQSRMVIKAPNGNFLRGEQNGILTAKMNDMSKATQWEY